MDGLILGQSVMMQLGAFQFGMATAAYAELRRSSEWRWAEQERFGKIAALQFTGPGPETITLPGIVFPEWRGGFGQVDAMRALGKAGQPLALVSGEGASMGRWVVMRVEEGQSIFAGKGLPRRVEFTLELKRFADAEAGAAASPIAGLVGGAGGAAIPAGASSPLDQVKGLAGSISSSARSLQATLTKAADQVRATVSPYAAIARDALGSVTRSLGVVGDLQDTANGALAAIGIRPIQSNILLHADNLATRANRSLSVAQSASAVLQNSSRTLATLQNVPPAATRAMQAAQAAADRTVSLTRQVAQEAGTIKGQTNG